MNTFTELEAANSARKSQFANIDALDCAPRNAARACETDIESMLRALGTTEVVFATPLQCRRWGFLLVSVEQLWPAPEEYGIQFRVSIGRATIQIDGFEAPAFLYDAARNALEDLLVARMAEREISEATI